MYDVGTSLGSYLLALGAAEPVLDETPARIVPIAEEPQDEEKPPKSSRQPLFEAADSPSRPSTVAQGAPSKVGRKR